MRSVQTKPQPRTGRYSLSHVNTKAKVLLSVVLTLVLTLAIGAIALVNLNRMDRTQGWVDHTQRVLGSATGIVAAAVDMETGMRGYLLAGEDKFLEPYESGNAAVFSALETMRITVGDNPPQVVRLQEAENVLRQWQTEVAEPQIALRRAIGDAATMNDMAALVRKGEGKVFFDRFRGQIATFIDAEVTLLAQRQTTFSQVLSSGEASLDETREALAWVDHTHKVIATAKDILAAAVDMETGIRGYFVAGDEVFLEPYTAGNAVFHKLIQDLAVTVADNPPQVALLGEAESTINQWLQDVVTPMLDLRRQIGVADTMDDMADLVGEARGKVFFDKFRALMAEFSAIEQNLMVTRKAENDATRQMTEMTIAVALAAAMVIGISIALLVGSNIGTGVKRLTSLMERLADGDNDLEITGQRRRDEIGAMARATEVFKQNAIRIAKLSEEQETARAEMATMAQEREKSAQREIALAHEKEEADRQIAQAREAMMIDLGVSFGQVVEAAIDGEFSKRVEAKFSDRILNELAENINQLLMAVDHGLSETGRTLERVAGGDLTQPMTGEFRGAFAHLQSDANDMIDALRSLVGEISASGSTVALSSAELRDTSGELASQTEQNAASLEETSASLEQLSKSIKLVSGNVTEASKNALAARDTAQSSEGVAADAASSMNRIADASREITRVVRVIDDIAFQINLLALNAGVEAARAGDAGRGFSVVASEVRQLAQRASEASKEIAAVITNSDAAVSEGVKKVSDAQCSLELIAKSVVSISSGVDEISDTISQQVMGVSEISAALTQIDQNTQRQAAAFEEVTAASTLLANEADGLSHATARFQTEEGDNIVVMEKPRTAPEKQIRPQPVAAGSGQVAVARNGDWDEF